MLRNLLNTRLKSCLLALALYFALPLSAVAAEEKVPSAPAAATKAEPTQVQVGAYVLRIANVSQKDGTFDVDLWLWFRWKGDGVAPYKTFEIANGVISNRTETEVLDDEGFHYTTVRAQATVFHDYDVKRFPLDDHRLTVEVEDSTYDSSTLQYVADEGTALDPGLNVPGWAVKLAAAKVREHHYPTSYGMRSSGTASAVYSRYIIPVELARTGNAVLFKEFWISLLSVTLGLLALLVKSDDLDARFGLGVGSIFAASANAFVLSDALPKTTTVTLAEQINFLAVGAIFLSVFVSIWSLRLRYAGREEASLKLDRQALVVLAVAYLAANAWLLWL